MRSLTAKEKFELAIEEYYETWLLKNYSDEIHTDEQHLKAVEDKRYIDEFHQHIIKELEW